MVTPYLRRVYFYDYLAKIEVAGCKQRKADLVALKGTFCPAVNFFRLNDGDQVYVYLYLLLLVLSASVHAYVGPRQVLGPPRRASGLATPAWLAAHFKYIVL